MQTRMIVLAKQRPRREFSMLNWMISRILLAAVLSTSSCFGRAAEPLKIGMVASLTGSAAEVGRYRIQGAKLATEEVNKTGGVLGRPIELVIEDDQTTNPGVVLAFSKLAGDKDIPAFIGPTFSTAIHAIAPDIQRLGKPVMIGGTDPAANPHGQSVAVPISPKRHLFGPGNRRLRCENTRQEEVGDRPLDRRLRHQRHEKFG